MQREPSFKPVRRSPGLMMPGKLPKLHSFRYESGEEYGRAEQGTARTAFINGMFAYKIVLLGKDTDIAFHGQGIFRGYFRRHKGNGRAAGKTVHPFRPRGRGPAMVFMIIAVTLMIGVTQVALTITQFTLVHAVAGPLFGLHGGQDQIGQREQAAEQQDQVLKKQQGENGFKKLHFNPSIRVFYLI